MLVYQNPKPKGRRIVLSAVADLKTGDVNVGLSVCVPEDKFNKQEGINRATDKAIVYFDRNHNRVSGNPILSTNINVVDNSLSIKKQINKILVDLRNEVTSNIDKYLTRNNHKH